MHEQLVGEFSGDHRQPRLGLADRGTLLARPSGEGLDQIHHVGQVDHMRLIAQPGDELLAEFAVVDRRVRVQPPHRPAQVGPPLRRVGEVVWPGQLAEVEPATVHSGHIVTDPHLSQERVELPHQPVQLGVRLEVVPLLDRRLDGLAADGGDGGRQPRGRQRHPTLCQPVRYEVVAVHRTPHQPGTARPALLLGLGEAVDMGAQVLGGDPLRLTGPTITVELHPLLAKLGAKVGAAP